MHVKCLPTVVWAGVVLLLMMAASNIQFTTAKASMFTPPYTLVTGVVLTAAITTHKITGWGNNSADTRGMRVLA